MGQRRLQQRLTDEVVGQQPRPEFLSHPLGPRAAESIEPHRGLIPHAAESETFSRNANGVRAIYVLPAFSPTPLALGLNVKGLIHGRARYDVAQFELYHPASAIKRRDLGASIDLVIEQRSQHDE